ncbi:hypothetical protein AB0F13_21240 [Streptomyces sp. NPDC026206]|uniref:hypothetical protein n=1 Tax=Streptomyces sp. NPDC026206 TaxID=3157089 RepID=UPI0033E23AA3
MSGRKKTETATGEVLKEFEKAEKRPGSGHEGDAADALTPSRRAQEASQGGGDGRTDEGEHPPRHGG